MPCWVCSLLCFVSVLRNFGCLSNNFHSKTCYIYILCWKEWEQSRSQFSLLASSVCDLTWSFLSMARLWSLTDPVHSLLLSLSLSLCLPDGGGDLLSQIMQWITQKHNHPKSHTINLSFFLFTNTQTHTEQVSCWVGATWWLSPVYNKCLQPPGLQSSRHASRRSTCCACVALFLHS